MTTEDVINLTQIQEYQDVNWDKAATKALLDFWFIPVMNERDTLDTKIRRSTVPFKVSDIFHCEALGVTDHLYIHGARTRIFDVKGNQRTVTEPAEFIRKKLAF